MLILIAWFACALISPVRAAADDEKAQTEFFEREIRPLLVERCQKCHGAEKPKGGLQLISRDSLARGGLTGPAVVAGKPAESALIKAVNYQDIEMPPDGRLKQEEIARLTRWVEQGAFWPAVDANPGNSPATEKTPVAKPAEAAPAFAITPAQRAHWAFQPPKLEVPTVVDTSWPKSDIDRFVLHKLEARGLKPTPPADKRALIRRATFDLIGLPPTPQEVEAFIADASPRAFARVVERLLASPHYGERWARHWLDVVRYTDSFDSRVLEAAREFDCGEAWRYRDWVVRAMNRDMPYDRFITEQIAGDLAAAAGQGGYDPGPVIATGMLAIGNWGGGDADKEKLLTDIADDQVDVVSRAFLGLTVSCARCHDHKFDPISTEDYYGLAGIFFSSHILTSVGEKTGSPPLVKIPLAAPDDIRKRDERKRRIDELTAQLAQITAEPARAEATAALEKLKANEPPPLDYANGVQEGGVPQTAHAGIHDVAVHLRGRYDRLGAVVPRRFPVILAGDKQQPIGSGSGRLQLAQWIAKADNPLTARVMVNRIWQHHFGRGIVATPGNFGQQGERPTHPELLDWLAMEFVRSGWSIKGMHRAMMLSATYQQASVPTPATLAADPENKLFGHMRRRRLDAEEIRDGLLAVSGQLDLTLRGPAIRDTNAPRRTLYLMTVRSDRATFRELFDAADPTAVIDERNSSTVAPQALYLLNHPFVQDRAAALAARALAEGPAEERARIDWLYRVLYARPAEEPETEIGVATLAATRAHSPAADAERLAWEQYAHLLLCANEMIVVD